MLRTGTTDAFRPFQRNRSASFNLIIPEVVVPEWRGTEHNHPGGWACRFCILEWPNTLVGETDAYRVPIKFYALSIGEYQINIGPDYENHVAIFTGLPPSHVYFKHFELDRFFK